MTLRDRPVLLPVDGPPAREPLVHQAVAARARDRPTAPALVFADRTVSFGELDAEANRLAHHLRDVGVAPGVLVAVHLDRSPEHYATLLAVLKAGGAYLPLDPNYPVSRLHYMIEDSAARILVTRKDLRALPTAAVETVIDIAADAERIAAWPSTAPPETAGADDLAYVTYTSASTGKPKGAMNEHGGLANLSHWHGRAYGLTPDDRGALLAPLSFDGAALDLWPVLAAGASALVVPEEIRTDMPALQRAMSAHDVTIAFLTTALGQILLAQPGLDDLPLRHLLIGGEALHRRPRRDLPFQVVNIYGPTETSMYVTGAVLAPEGATDDPIPIGWPIDGVTLYVLDDALRPVPDGTAGELCIGGAAVGRGYLGRPDLTADRFPRDPFADDPDARLYRTGDQVRRRADGAVEFLGRLDRQVKIRGHRVELEEVEAAIAEHPAVSQAAATVYRPSPDVAQLIGYAVPRPQWTEAWEPGNRRSEQLSAMLAGSQEPATHPAEWAVTSARLGKAADGRVFAAGPAALAERLDGLAAFLDERDFAQSGVSSLTAVLHGQHDLVLLDGLVRLLAGVDDVSELLELAVAHTADAGRVVVSRVRHAGLLAAEIGRREAEADDVTAAELRARVAGRLAADPEFAVSPAVLASLAERLPRVAAVEVIPRYGASSDPLADLLYDVVLSIGAVGSVVARQQTPDAQTEWHDWTDARLDTAAVRRMLLAEERPALGVSGIPYTRFAETADFWRTITEAEPDTAVAQQPGASAAGGGSVRPSDLAALAIGTRYRLALSWAAGHADGSLDALWISDPDVLPDFSSVTSVNALRPAGSQPLLATDPLARLRDADFTAELGTFLADRYPAHLICDRFIVLDRLPLNPVGKIDRERLPPPVAEAPEAGQQPGAAPSAAEEAVAAIVADVLGVRHVGIDDDLKALGAHSLVLTLVASRITGVFEIDVPLREMFAEPRVRAIAALVERAVGEAVSRTDGEQKTSDD